MRRTFADDNAQEMTPPRQPLRVLIADDHPLVRHSFRQDLEVAGIEVCAEAATGAAAVRAALAERPDLCLLDMRMPEGGGLARRQVDSPVAARYEDSPDHGPA